jgi:hypothetical protein
MDFYQNCSVESNKINSESCDSEKSSPDQDEQPGLRKPTLEEQETYRCIKIGRDLMAYYYYYEQ